jgi:triosephosphate isomerase
MTTRRYFVGGNWKSNNTRAQTQDLVNNVLAKLEFDAAKVGNNFMI